MVLDYEEVVTGQAMDIRTSVPVEDLTEEEKRLLPSAMAVCVSILLAGILVVGAIIVSAWRA